MVPEVSESMWSSLFLAAAGGRSLATKG
jgi:hypothetical protein